MTAMNKEWILFNLKEDHEELIRMIQEIERDPEYDFGEYSVHMEHLYHHINTAWNSRGLILTFGFHRRRLWLLGVSTGH